MLYKAIILMVILLLGGCGTSLVYHQPNSATGLFPTSHVVTRDEILVFKPIALQQYKRLLVVGLINTFPFPAYKEERFWLESISSLHIFNHVVLPSDLNAFLEQQGYSGKVASAGMYDLSALSNLQKVYGKFLVIEISTDLGSIDIPSVGYLKIIDPADGKIYFMIKHKALDINGLDVPLYYPMLNALAAWLRANNLD